jgi:hypothetical protein
VTDAKSTGAKPPKERAAKEAAKAEKRKVKEARRKAKKRKNEEPDSRAFAYAPGGDRDNVWDDGGDRNDRRDLRAESRSDRPRRERVIVRHEGDDDGDRVSDRDGRRVVVIRRGGRERDDGDSDGGGFGGGIFENLFGN